MTDEIDPTRYVWCSTHEMYTPRSCLGPECVTKETVLEEVDEDA